MILVVTAHPDDEALGCGGTIAREAAAGEDICVLFLADGETARPGAGEADIERREQEAREATTLLGAKNTRFARLPDNRLDSVPLLDVVRAVESVLEEMNPHSVLTHHGSDLNIDHEIAFRAVMTACRPKPGASVRVIRSFETLSATEWSSTQPALRFVPNHYVDISEQLDTKIAALKVYDDEMPPFPHARSIKAIEARALARGAECGVAAAEAFQTIREIR